MGSERRLQNSKPRSDRRPLKEYNAALEAGPYRLSPFHVKKIEPSPFALNSRPRPFAVADRADETRVVH